LVVLDELTQGLDPSARRNVWAAVAQLRLEGTTVLLVTHELDEAEALCDRVVAMRGGRVLDRGHPTELVARHAGWAQITFTTGDADLPDGLRRVPGVHRVEVAADRVHVHGDRRAIAEVGAELVRRGDVPFDLDVVLPDLESALLHLLDTPVPTRDNRELVTTR
jgi:ABC-2 type transport system ATP-binding protein